MKFLSQLVIFAMLLNSSFVFAAKKGGKKKAKKVAKVKMLKGKVYRMDGAKRIALKKGKWVREGVRIKTKKGSFVKLLFIDRSEMNIGPKSEVQVEKFSKSEPGIINVLKGNLRAKVTKQLSKEGNSKLYIKTKTAAMGIRGTEFNCIVNPMSGATSVVAIEGLVNMMTMKPGMAFSPEAAETTFQDPSKVTPIIKGTVATADGKSDAPTPPTFVSKQQLFAIKANDTGVVEESAHTEESKVAVARPAAPPGVSLAAAAPDDIADSIGDVAPAEVVQVAEAEIKQEEQSQAVYVAAASKTLGVDLANVPPGGLADIPGGRAIPAKGAVVSMVDGSTVTPPKGAVYDPNVGEFKVPKDLVEVKEDGSLATKPGTMLVNGGIVNEKAFKEFQAKVEMAEEKMEQENEQKQILAEKEEAKKPDGPAGPGPGGENAPPPGEEGQIAEGPGPADGEGVPPPPGEEGQIAEGPGPADGERAPAGDGPIGPGPGPDGDAPPPPPGPGDMMAEMAKEMPPMVEIESGGMLEGPDVAVMTHELPPPPPEAPPADAPPPALADGGDGGPIGPAPGEPGGPAPGDGPGPDGEEGDLPPIEGDFDPGLCSADPCACGIGDINTCGGGAGVAPGVDTGGANNGGNNATSNTTFQINVGG